MEVLFETEVENALQVLRNGGVILYPTDTIWGIGCDATNEEAVRKIYSIKQREDSKSLIILVAGERDILQYVAAPDPGVFNFIEELMPGLDFIPTFTIMWLIQYFKKEKAPIQVKAI